MRLLIVHVFLGLFLEALTQKSSFIAASWNAVDIWAYFHTMEGLLDKGAYKYYGEIQMKNISISWLAGGESNWRNFLNATVSSIKQSEVTSLVLMHKDYRYENISICTDSNAISSILSLLTPSSPVLHQISCNGSSWNFRQCNSGCVGLCVDCSNPCYSSCDASTVIYPTGHGCVSKNGTRNAVVQFFGIQTPLEKKPNTNNTSTKKVEQLIIVVVLSVLLAVVIGTICICFFSIMTRRRNLKRRRRLDKEAWKMENMMRKALAGDAVDRERASFESDSRRTDWDGHTETVERANVDNGNDRFRNDDEIEISLPSVNADNNVDGNADHQRATYEPIPSEEGYQHEDRHDQDNVMDESLVISVDISDCEAGLIDGSAIEIMEFEGSNASTPNPNGSTTTSLSNIMEALA